MKVLTVDDSRTIRVLVKKALEPLGLDILEATNGQEGAEVAQREIPDLIILDVTMPVLDGKGALEQIRGCPSTKHIPVLMLTAESRKDLVISLIKLGVSDYIVKPFTPDLLLGKVSKILKLDQAPTQQQSPEIPEGSDGTLPRVLVFDDKESVLLSARKYLAETATVITAKEAQEALEFAHKYVPQVVILDLIVPDVNVFEVFSIMRANERLQSSRFVAMAIRTMHDAMARARQAGFHDLLLKPFDQKAIVRVVRWNLLGSTGPLTFDQNLAIFLYPSLSERDVAGLADWQEKTCRRLEGVIAEVADSAYENFFAGHE